MPPQSQTLEDVLPVLSPKDRLNLPESDPDHLRSLVENGVTYVYRVIDQGRLIVGYGGDLASALRQAMEEYR
jgi:hypothetical protein